MSSDQGRSGGKIMPLALAECHASRGLKRRPFLDMTSPPPPPLLPPLPSYDNLPFTPFSSSPSLSLLRFLPLSLSLRCVECLLLFPSSPPPPLSRHCATHDGKPLFESARHLPAARESATRRSINHLIVTLKLSATKFRARMKLLVMWHPPNSNPSTGTLEPSPP